MKPAIRYLLYGQICFYVGLLTAIIIMPQSLGANEGISYFGTRHQVIIPYIFALLGSAYFTIKAAEHIRDLIIKRALILMGLFTIGVMITPDALSAFMDGLHRACGASLFVIQLLLSFWFIYKLRKPLIVVFTATELAGGIAAFIWLSPKNGLLLQAQVVFQLGFAGVLFYSLWLLNQAEISGTPK